MSNESIKIVRRTLLIAGLACLIVALWPRYTHLIIPAPQFTATTHPGIAAPAGDLEGYNTNLTLGLPNDPAYHFTDHKLYDINEITNNSGRLLTYSKSMNWHYSDTIVWTSRSALIAYGGFALLLLTQILRPRQSPAAS